ncbi:MAG TPA: hypothetical protein PKC72_13950 [Chitinophagaceae bacterium]|nr:hypothetical protein [Chitinophagaceae bacterium]
MFKLHFTTIIIFSLFILSCHNKENISGNQEKAIEEIANAEKDFEKMAKEKGIMEAFWYFADSNAVIKRANDSLIKGKEGIRNYYSDPYFKTASVTWMADFIDASESSDMGYSYGSYVWQSKDSTGQTKESKGIFHTVWKKQADGNWKYVWD